MPKQQAAGSDRHPRGLDVIQNDDGTFTLEWDQQDPRWQVLNDLDEDQITAIIQEQLQLDIDDNGPTT